MFIVELVIFFSIKTGTSSWRMLTISSSVGLFTMAVNPSLAFSMARVRSAGLVADMMANKYRVVVES